MEKKILIPVDESIHTRHAIEYAVRMSSVVKPLTFTLFFVHPPVSQYLLSEARLDFKANAEIKKVIRKNAETANRILEGYKAMMIRLGIDETCVDIRSQSRILGVAKDILDLAETSLYDAIVVGRRGLSRAQRAIMGSVTAALVEHSRVTPLWVIDGDVKSMKIMVAADGSKNTLRAVDHLTFMIGANPKIHITLFHVVPRFGDYCEIDFGKAKRDIEETLARGAKQCVDDFYDRALEKFRSAGLRDSQIHFKTTTRTVGVAKAIMEEARKDEHGTIVVGRRGESQSYFMGSVSRQVLVKASNRAVWLVT